MQNIYVKKRYRLTQSDFLKKCYEIHKNLYDYSESVYINMSTKIKICCNFHGIFIQTPNSHLNNKSGCPKCKGVRLSISKRGMTKDKFIKLSNKLYNRFYDYSLVSFDGPFIEKIEIICPIHGSFLQRWKDHLYGKGCYTCGRISSGKKKKDSASKKFVDAANEIHNYLYDYSLVNYQKATLKVKIICNTHGIFEQSPNSHLAGHGCRACGFKSSGGPSKISNKWLDEYNIKSEYREIPLILSTGRCIKVDAFDPVSNTIYEFWGDYWHGNPLIYNEGDINKVTNTTFGELYSQTISKRQSIINDGYNLIEIWGSEYSKILSSRVQL